MANARLSTIRWLLWGAVGALAIVAVATTYLGAAPSASAERYGTGDYELVTDAGETVDDMVFVGQPSAVFFGFTHCPEVCPTTMADMSHWFAELGPEADKLRAFFVTVDPERDTPEVLGDYVSWVSDRITGLTGTQENIDKIVSAWSVYAQRVPLDGGGYNMDHTASVFLLNARGEFEGTIAYGEASETAIGKLRRLIAES
ncbi:SCO family protein [Pelagibacterium xiamenense]|uniref:SCO family protein n=1 Tax=Pelagibacterium xiamenense TaxID=2901140 RepID=UPI001E498CD6|nr:SCO family protein [Pelagibacterium xiamenense]MCD7060203.1 SCO family protein [Pelagibacterium xiamenense]